MDNNMPDEDTPYSTENIEALKMKLGVTFENDELLRTAISTRAARNEHPDIIKEDNERLEFLGDSVLKFLLSENLYKSKPKPEGVMTIMRTEIENNETLALIAKELDLKPHLFLGEAEKKSSGKRERTVLANALEAIIGAIYLDTESLVDSRRFLEKKILHELLQILLTEDVRNPITPLQEISQKRYGLLPKYECRQISGTPNEPIYLAEVFLNKKKVAEAQGTSIKDSKRKAAKKALFLITT